MYKKNVKKYVLMMVALLLVCVVSVAGTLAYLSATTSAVTNTFVIGELFEGDPEDPDDPQDPTDDIGLTLREHKVTYAGNGVYTLSQTEEVTTNTYDKILPGVDVSKDPFVRTNGLQQDAYLFIEVVNGLPEGLTAVVDTDNWTVTTLTGKHGGTVYVYALNGGVITEDLVETNILEGNVIDVAGNYQSKNQTSLSFYGYIIQAAGSANYTEAWGKF